MSKYYCVSGAALARQQRWANRLLAGASIATLAVVLPWSQPALAQDVRSYNNYGVQRFLWELATAESGRDAEVHSLFGTDTPSTRGHDATGFSIRNHGTLGVTNTQGLVPIRLESIGGNGGNADWAALTSAMQHGSVGGNGGSLRLENYGILKAGRLQGRSIVSMLSQGGKAGTFGAVDQAFTSGSGGGIHFLHKGEEIQAESRSDANVAAIRLRSVGGEGSAGSVKNKLLTSGNEILALPGSGGNAGSVSADIQSNISVWGGKYVAVHATSQGGAAGYGGTPLDTPGLVKAGQAGPVTIDIGRGVTIHTVGDRSPVIIAEALGGAGADVMSTEDARGSDGASLGGTRENPSVRVTNNGTVDASGLQSTGILAQSIGGVGGGGQQGLGHGGAGGNGGSGGFVVVEQNGTVKTYGTSSYGIVAQSVGGGGGTGGNDVFLGGNGGQAGNGGGVYVANRGTITTNGQNAAGIVAQSVGGGNALSAFNAVLPTTEPGGGNGGSGGLLFFGKGGAGGAGGKGGAVTVDNHGSIRTLGEGALGIFAQSIGGGGGGGGTPRIGGILFSAALGGKGGSGTEASDVVVNNLWKSGHVSIETNGRFATGILAQSVGGGGGYGGGATAVAVGPQLSFSLAVGGSGGSGGKAGNVTINNGILVTTRGDDAPGLYAISVGGGGGVAGDALSVAASVGVRPELPTVSFARAVGGDGGVGNTAGTARVHNTADIATFGENSAGIRVRSIGGGGGDGGTAQAATINVPLKSVATISLTSALGGNGGQGGAGGLATVENFRSITTQGAFSSAISAYSIGGGGGDAGSSEIMAKDFPVKSGMQLKLTRNVGGTGGSGNIGGNVVVTNAGTLSTMGPLSHGIEAVSIGGGGGVGGDSSMLKLPGAWSLLEYSDSIAALVQSGGNRLTANISHTVGGDGGTGAVAGAVTVTNSGTISARATAIQAQSIGGGGGNAGAASLNQSSNVSMNRSVGGNGGSGGDGNTVTVTTTGNGTITTVGDGAQAIFAQSIGGGGGHGGNASSESGGSGVVSNQYVQALKGPVKYAFMTWLTSSSKETRELFGHAAYWLASWVGKGDKAREWAQTAKKPNLPVSVSINSAVGGGGGAGGDGKAVTVTNTMGLSTHGEAATAIFAQSVGGGGGAAGQSNVGSQNMMNIRHALGGTGGAGGKGDRVTITNSGSISTQGQSSFGIVGQSIGGGGGTAGTTVDLQAGLMGIPSDVMGSMSLKHMVGGTSGAHGDAGAVEIVSSGAINTGLGGEAHGIVAQSVGGGGGLSVINLVDPDETLRMVAAGEALPDVRSVFEHYGVNLAEEKANAQKLIAANRNLLHQQNITLGGDHASGHGDKVVVTLNNTVTTGGAGAIGVVAQSIGGGGGLISSGGGGGDSYRNTFQGQLGGVHSSGDGRRVNLYINRGAAISTQGAGALGILAQSIGGGGGYVGSFNASPSTLGLLLGASHETSGSGGDITLHSYTTSITTKGARAHGILAQSLGGGGGYMAQAVIPTTSNAPARSNVSGGSGAITISTEGDFRATGADSYGIVAQTGIQKTDGSIDNSRASGNIRITHDGVIQGGSASGAAIRMDGGIDNQVTLGRKADVSALSGTAIIGSANRDTLSNYGMLTGDVLLARGVGNAGDVFDNHAGATFTTGTTIDLGARGRLGNSGTLNVAGTDRIATAQLVGSLTLDPKSLLQMDVSSLGGAHADMLRIDGTGALAGRLEVNAKDSLRQQTFEVMKAGGGMTGSIEGKGPGTWNAITWAVRQTAHGVTVTPQANFMVPVGMTFTPAEDDFRLVLQKTWDNQELTEAGARLYAAMAKVGSQAQYRNALDSLAPDESASTMQLRVEGARASMNSALSCPVFEGPGAAMRESECAWARVAAAHVAQADTSSVAGYGKSSGALRMGAQRELADGWYAGVATGYTWSRLTDNDGFSVTDGHSFDASASIKREWNGWQFGLVGHLGYGSFGTNRQLVFGPTQWSMQGTSQVFTAGTRLRAAHQFSFDNWYVRPYADLDVIYMGAPAHREQGAFSSMSFDASQSWGIAFSPTLEIGARVNVNEMTWMRPYASAGITTMARSGTKVGGTMNIGTGDDRFTFETKNPDLLFNVGAGVQLFHSDRVEVRGEYKASFSPGYVEQEGTVRFSVKF